jgi:metal-responsive CopG/Arc/MetJ family transcriptional regulator
MNSPTLSPRQLALLTSLVTAPARKAKASVTLSGNLLKVIDTLAGSSHRSAWIERAVRSYARRQLKQQRRARELELLNRHAKTLNEEGADSAAYQSSWDPE